MILSREPPFTMHIPSSGEPIYALMSVVTPLHRRYSRPSLRFSGSSFQFAVKTSKIGREKVDPRQL